MNLVENKGCAISSISSIDTFCADNISDVILTDLSSRQQELIEMLDVSEVFQSVSKKAPIKIKGGFVREFCAHFTENIQREFGFDQPEQAYRAFKDIDGMIVSKVDLSSELGKPIVIEREGGSFYLFRIHEEIEKEFVFFDENQEAVPVLFEHDLINFFYFQGKIYIDREGFLEGVLALHQKQLKLIPDIEQVEYDVFGRTVAYLTWGWNVDPSLLNTLKNHCCKLEESIEQALKRHFSYGSLESQVFVFNAILWGGTQAIWRAVSLFDHSESPCFEGLAPYLQQEVGSSLSAALFLLNALKHPTFAKIEGTCVTLYSQQNRFFVQLPASIEDLIESLVSENLSKEWLEGDLAPLMLEDSVVDFIASLFDRSFDLCHFFLLRYYYAVYEANEVAHFPKHWESILTASGPIRQPWLLDFLSKRKLEFALCCFLKLSSEEKKQMANFIDQAAMRLSPSSLGGVSGTLLSLRSYISTKSTLDALFFVLIKKKEKENLYKFLGSSIHTRESLCSYIAELLLYPTLWEEKGLLKFVDTAVLEGFFDKALYQGVLNSISKQKLKWPNGKIAHQLLLYYQEINDIEQAKQCIKRDIQSSYANTLPDDYGMLLLRFWEMHGVCFEHELLTSNVSDSILKSCYLFLVASNDNQVELVKKYRLIANRFVQEVVEAISSPYQKILCAQLLKKEEDLVWDTLLQEMPGSEIELILSRIPSSVINQQVCSILLERLSDKKCIQWLQRLSKAKKQEIASEELIEKLLSINEEHQKVVELLITFQGVFSFSEEQLDVLIDKLNALDQKTLIPLVKKILDYPKIQKFVRKMLKEQKYSSKNGVCLLEALLQQSLDPQDLHLLSQYSSRDLIKWWIPYFKTYPLDHTSFIPVALPSFLKYANHEEMNTLMQFANVLKEEADEWLFVWLSLYDVFFDVEKFWEQVFSLPHLPSLLIPFVFSKIETSDSIDVLKKVYEKFYQTEDQKWQSVFLIEFFSMVKSGVISFSRDRVEDVLDWMQGSISSDVLLLFVEYFPLEWPVNPDIFISLINLFKRNSEYAVLDRAIPLMQYLMYDLCRIRSEIESVYRAYSSLLVYATRHGYYDKDEDDFKCYVDQHFIVLASASFLDLDPEDVKNAASLFLERTRIHPQSERVFLQISFLNRLSHVCEISEKEKMGWIKQIFSQLDVIPNGDSVLGPNGLQEPLLLYLFKAVYPIKSDVLSSQFSFIPCDEVSVLELFYQKIQEFEQKIHSFESEESNIIFSCLSFSLMTLLFLAAHQENFLSMHIKTLEILHKNFLDSPRRLYYFTIDGVFNRIFHTLLDPIYLCQGNDLGKNLKMFLDKELDVMFALLEGSELEEKKALFTQHLEIAFEHMEERALLISRQRRLKLLEFKKKYNL